MFHLFCLLQNAEAMDLELEPSDDGSDEEGSRPRAGDGSRNSGDGSSAAEMQQVERTPPKPPYLLPRVLPLHIGGPATGAIHPSVVVCPKDLVLCSPWSGLGEQGISSTPTILLNLLIGVLGEGF